MNQAPSDERLLHTIWIRGGIDPAQDLQVCKVVYVDAVFQRYDDPAPSKELGEGNTLSSPIITNLSLLRRTALTSLPNSISPRH